jgi:ATP-dependent DNA helicase RecG
LFGRVGEYKGQRQMVHPEVISWHGGPLPQPEVRPIYPDMEDVKAGALRKIVGQAARELEVVPRVFPGEWLTKRELQDPIEALRTLHQPPADKSGPLPRPEESRAWKNLALYELLFLQLSLARSRARQAGKRGWAFPKRSELAIRFVEGLPFELTDGQRQVLREIITDMSAPRPMSRLLQGDVGSGKTVAALTAAFTAVDGGKQAAIMAPTEILARQHFQTLKPHADRLGVRVDLLVGGLSEAEKAARRLDVAEGRTRIVVGTHALIAAGLEFESLGLAVIDEQHRFGVAQRLALRAKADQPDILVMTATPIPRTLALTLYGDLEVSSIRELPPGRLPVKTEVFGPENRQAAYKKLAREISEGGRAYIVAPRIEANEEDTVEDNSPASVEALYEFVTKEVLESNLVGLVHGRMKTDEQSAVVADFQAGRIKALVATTVIEVGLDVPEATMILVESAERFGLAQLHQLRGRVGRGDRAARCLLISGQPGPPPERLKVMARTADGFILAEEDLKLRGPGDLTGRRQTGLPPLIWAKLPRDLPLLLKARDMARELIDRDPELETPSFKLVREVVDRLDDRIQAEAVEAG